MSEQNAKRWWASISQKPPCIGEYERGALRCDGGVRHCPMLEACRAFKAYAGRAGASAPTLRAAMPEKVFRDFLWSLLGTQDAKGPKVDQRRETIWRAFVAAFRQNLPEGTVIASSRAAAIPLDLYEWVDSFGRRRLSVRMLLDPDHDMHITQIGTGTRKLPTISVAFKIYLDDLRRLYPQIDQLACEWHTRSTAPWRTVSPPSFRTWALNVQPKSVEQIARLMSLLLVTNNLHGAPWPPAPGTPERFSADAARKRKFREYGLEPQLQPISAADIVKPKRPPANRKPRRRESTVTSVKEN